MKDFTHGHVGRQIILFSLPIIIGNIFMQLYQMVDSVIVGQYLGKEALAAVGASTPAVFAVIALVIGVGSGASVVISQYFGSGRLLKVRVTCDTLHIVLLVMGGVIGVFGWFCSDWMLRLMGLPEELVPLGEEYLRVYFAGVFLLFGFNTISAILRGVGDSRTPLYFLAVAAVLNVVLDYWFIVSLEWGVASAAWATVISQGVAYFMSILYINRRDNIVFHINLWRLKFNKRILFQCLRYGLPTGIQQTFIAFGMVALMGVVNHYGTDTIAAFSAGMRIDAFALIPAMNFSMALTSFTAQNIGAGRPDRAIKGLGATLLFSSLTCVLMTLVIVLFGDAFFRMFTFDTAVIELGNSYLVTVSLFYLFYSTMFAINGMLKGAGAVIVPMLITFLALWGVRIPLAYTAMHLTDMSGMDIVAWSIVVGWIVGAGLSVAYYSSGRWKGKSIFDKK